MNQSYQEWQRNGFTISTARARMQVDVIHDFVSNRSYWMPGVSKSRVQSIIDNALNFGIFEGEKQVGYADVVTDFTTFAYLANVFVLEEYRGQGLSKWLMECILSYPDLQDLRRWLLATADAHGLYEQYGFKTIETPERWMERFDAESYKKEKL